AVEGIRPVAPRRSRDDPQASLVLFRGVHADPVCNDVNRRAEALPGVDPQVSGASGDDDADVRVVEIRAAHRLEDGRAETRPVEGNFEINPSRRSVEPVEVILQPEYPSIVGADPFEDPVAVEHPMVE